MAKTVTVTNPVTGQPAQVDQLDHTAQQIDDAILKVKYLTGRNLLDNAYWASPDAIIDQRGGYVVPPGTAYYSDTTPGSSPVGTTAAYYTATVINTYWVTITISGVAYYVPMTAAVRGYAGNGYTIDRWYQQLGLVTTISENGLTLICTASYNRFRHYMEGIAIAGKTVTASILTASGELIASTGVFSAGNTMRITGYNLYFRFEVESNRCVFDFFFGEGGGSITIKAAKLELGSVQTLAHQENGNWVLNDPPPDKALELVKCQTDQIKLGGSPASGYAISATQAVLIFSLPTTMRVTPSISYSGALRIEGTWGSGDNGKEVTALTVNSMSGNCIKVFATTSGLTPGQACVLSCRGTAAIFLDSNR